MYQNVMSEMRTCRRTNCRLATSLRDLCLRRLRGVTIE